MEQKSMLNFLLFVFLMFGVLVSSGQDPNRFNDQVEALVNKEHNFCPGKKLLVFAGSSSVRMWKDVPSYFPEYNAINNGFGGSHFSDLLYFYDELITKYSPDILFIYEGDNDIASDKKPWEVFKEAKELVSKIQQDLPDTKIVLISSKPSVARWHLSKNYQKLNKKLERLCKGKNNLEFADVWSAMLDENGQVYSDVFLDDNLHMNKKGYDIWGEVIGKHLE